MESDKLTSSRDAFCPYLTECGLYKRSWDKSNYLRAIMTRGDRIVNLEANQRDYK
jgi:hypothetical protein